MAPKKQVATIASNGKVRFLGPKYVERRRRYGLYRRVVRSAVV